MKIGDKVTHEGGPCVVVGFRQVHDETTVLVRRLH